MCFCYHSFIGWHGFFCENNTRTNIISHTGDPTPDSYHRRLIVVGKQQNVHWLTQVSTAWLWWENSRTFIGGGKNGRTIIGWGCPLYCDANKCKHPGFSPLLAHLPLALRNAGLVRRRRRAAPCRPELSLDFSNYFQ